MPRHASQVALVSMVLLACSAGSNEGLTSLSGAYSAGPAEGGDMDESGTGGSEGSEGGGAEGPISTAGSADGTGGGSDGGEGNPLCCEVGLQAGCGSQVTEACVCTSQPLCCSNVWSQQCVDLAVACGDPFCSDAPGTDDGSTGEPGVDLECDPDFVFAPENPAAGVAFEVTFSDPVGLTWVAMRAEGPGGAMAQGTNEVISGMGPFHWSYDFAGLAAGVWTFSFTHKQTENGPDLVAGVCQKQF